MNLFELFVKIGVDDKASGAIKKITSGLGNGLKTAAKIGTAAVGVAAAGITALTAAAVNNYAEYEQLVGGVDTLFKNASKKVQQYAADAYKTSGMSANDYMANATAFSASLISSLGGDTEAAAEYANRAMVSMSDNANKMGTSLDSIVQTYQSLSRGNFAMLDNLKLGYGGTKAELERLIKDAASYTAIQKEMGITVDASSTSFDNIVNAIAVVQGHLGIAGATAAEAATTIEGSANSMKASWNNLVTGIADENADLDLLIANFVGSVGNYADNLLPRIEIAIVGAGSLIEKIVPTIAGKVPALLAKTLPQLIRAAVNTLKSIANGIIKNAKVITKTAKDIVLMLSDGIVDLIPDIVDSGVVLIEGIAEAVPKAIPKIVGEMRQVAPAMAKGLLSSGGALAGAIWKLMDPETWHLSEIRLELEKGLGAIIPFTELIGEAQKNLVDVSTAMSEKGRTIAEISEEIAEAEAKITQIIKKEYEQQDGYRQKDLQSIEKYNQRIQQLEREKLGIYRTSILAELSKVQLEAGDISVENLAQAYANAAKLLEDANAAVEQSYTAELSRIENWYNSLSEKTPDIIEQYENQRKAAKANRDEELKINSEYYSNAVNAFQDYSDDVSSLSAEQAAESANNIASILINAQKTYDEETKKIYDQYVGSMSEISREDAAALKEISANFKKEVIEGFIALDDEAYKTFFSILATTKKAGVDISEENLLIANSFFSIFDNMPATMSEDATTVMRSIVSGLESEIPGLENAAEKDAQAIVDTLREYLSDETMEGIGENAISGFAKGFVSGAKSAVKKVTDVAGDIISDFKKKLDIRSPSHVFEKFGIQSMEGYGNGFQEELENVKDDMERSLYFDDVMATIDGSIRNAGSSAAGHYAGGYGGSQDVNVTVTIDENVNAMGLARELLPYLKIAAQEAYA